MPRTLILGNGNMLIGYDWQGQVRDLYFPFVGLENQTGGQLTHKIGIWTEGNFRWFDHPSWQFTLSYKPETLSSFIVGKNQELGVELEMVDVVYNEKNIYIREIKVKNTTDRPRLIKIFFNQQFMLYDSYRRDTAFYDPKANVMIHYKGRRVALINAQVDAKGFDDYCTGLLAIEGKEGTWKDAEDGYLTKNPIEHGPVDSVIGLSLNLDPGKSKTVYYWICFSKLMEEAYQYNDYVLEKQPGYLIHTTQNFWLAWTNRQNIDFADLPKGVVDLFKRSLLIIRAHSDNDGGIIASCDSDMLQYGRDTYSYVWPRDGSFSAIALDKSGDHEIARRFFKFSAEVARPEGYLMHKYRPDKALGSSWHSWVNKDGVTQLPIQEDETALVIYALWEHYLVTKDLEFVEGIYSFIKKAAEFMCEYRYEKSGLPKGSFDLWEEKSGTSTFTSSTVYAALMAASKFADLLGKNQSAKHYREAAAEVKEGILKYLYDEKEGYFYRMLFLDSEVPGVEKTVDISSVYGVFRFGILDPDDPRLTRAISYTMHHLGLTTPIGGMARYEGDNYYRTRDGYPGNPWFIGTLWLAQYYLTQVKTPDDFGIVKKLLQWCVDHAMPTGILSEQLNPDNGYQISAAPLTWSHSEFVITVLDYLHKLKTLSS